MSFSSSKQGKRLIAVAMVVLITTSLHASAEQSSSETRIAFSGNRTYHENVLKALVQTELERLATGGHKAVWADDAAYRIKLFYIENGFYQAEVVYKITGSEDPRIDFQVNEGACIGLAKVRFEGNYAMPSSALIRFYQKEKMGFLGWGKKRYTENEVERMLRRIKGEYLRRGFLDMMIEKKEVRIDVSHGAAYLDIHITEGVQYHINKIVWPFQALQLQEKLFQIADAWQGKVYSSSIHLHLQSEIVKLYQENGYLHVQANVKEVRTGLGTIAFEVEIQPGILVRMGKVKISGNEKTSIDYLLNRVPYQPGDLVRRSLQDKLFSDLYGTGLFRRIDVQLVSREAEGIVDLQIALEESPSIEMFLEGGWGSYEQLRVKAGIAEKNLFGLGKQVRSEVHASFKGEGIECSLNEPRFLGSYTAADLPVFYRRRIEASYVQQENGIGLAFFRSIEPDISISAGYTYQQNRILWNAVEDSSEVFYQSGKADIKASIDRRNDIFYPTQGWMVYTGAEIADPALGGSADFIRCRIGARFFFSIDEQSVVGIRYQSGILLVGDGYLMPISERFFNGGEDSVRSFGESQLGPVNSAGDPIGGIAMNVVGLEFRRKLGKAVSVSLFFDSGNVVPYQSYEGSESESDSELWNTFLDGFQNGLGCGIQYLLPIGPVRLEWAFEPDSTMPGRVFQNALHFSIGAAY